MLIIPTYYGYIHELLCLMLNINHSNAYIKIPVKGLEL